MKKRDLLQNFLWILPNKATPEKLNNATLHYKSSFHKLILATYGILHPKVQWSEIPSTTELAEEVQKQIVCINTNETSKVELLHKIEVYQPNIIIFAGTFKEIGASEMEKIGWDISYSAKRYVNDDQLGNTTAFYITSPTRLCIEAFHPNDYQISDKTYWYEMKKAVELWEEFR